jgi:hypothetical protein
MKTDTLILLGVGGYLALRLGGLSRVSNSLVFAPASLKVNRKGTNITIEFGLDIENSAPAEVVVTRTYGDVVDPKGNVLGKFATPTYKIPAQGTTRIQIPIRLQLFGTALSVINAIVSKDLKVTINYTNEVGLLTTSDSYAFSLKEALNFPSKKNLKTGANEKVDNPLVK